MAILHRLSLSRLSDRLGRLLGAGRPATVRAPELWCRPATVLALRGPGRAGACLRGWR